MVAKKILMKDLKTNEANPRHIVEGKLIDLKRSIKEFPKMMELRPIIIDEDGVILGGNMRYRALLDLGYESLPAAWVKKAGDMSKAEKQEFIIKDNLPFGEWDWDILANEWEEELLSDWGLDIPKWDDEEEKKYTGKIEAPVYEPNNPKPKIQDLYDYEKSNRIIETIDRSSCTAEEKIFLRAAAARHIVFDYGKIADYYAHAGKDLQELFEDSALVIIDYGRAIEDGYVEFTKEINELQGVDHDGK